MSTLASLGRPESRFQNLLSTRAAALVGVAGAILTVAIANQPEAGLALGCISIVFLYGVYPTLSLGWGTMRERVIEWSYTAVGAASIVLAVAADPRWLAFGWAAHGAWDALHHHRHHIVGLRGIPPWYISMCLIWDIAAAVGLWVFL